MNLFTLKEKNDMKVSYIFLAEKRGEPGEIEYDFRANKVTLLQMPKDVDGSSQTWHYQMACSCLKRFAEQNKFPEKYLQAWY
jgi:hypothetical protein